MKTSELVARTAADSHGFVTVWSYQQIEGETRKQRALHKESAIRPISSGLQLSAAHPQPLPACFPTFGHFDCGFIRIMLGVKISKEI